MKNSQTWILPIHLKSEANIREHWTIKHKRSKQQQKQIETAFLCDKIDVPMPVYLDLIRIAPRPLDLDNLLFAFKNIRDFICDKLIPGLRPGRADSSNQIMIRYYQEKGKPKEYAIKIIMTKRNLLSKPSQPSHHDILTDFNNSEFCDLEENTKKL